MYVLITAHTTRRGEVNEMIYEMKEMEAMEMNSLIVSCTRGYTHYHKHRRLEPLVQRMLKITGNRWEKAVRWWVSNCVRTVRHKATGFTVSLHHTGYKNNVQGVGYRGVMNLLDLLEGLSYIDIYKGFVSEWRMDNGKIVPERVIKSVVVLKEKGLEFINNIDVQNKKLSDIEEQELVVIRDRETKEPKSTRGVRGIKEVRDKVKQINEHLSKSEITFEGYPIADVMYSRIYTDSIDRGGRLYALGGGVQTVPSEIRLSSLRIDGEPVIELDFSAIHPNICYQIMYSKDGLDVREMMGEDFCPYAADMSFIEVDEGMRGEWESLTGRKCNPVRDLTKLAILISMNSKDKGSAVASLAYKLSCDRRKDVIDQMFYPIVGKVSARMVCEAVQDHNDVIREHFFSDTGILLQKLDSDIMLEIVSTMLQKGHTVLCYHDSAIVKESAEEDLYKAMKDAWVAVLGDDTFCKIDKK